MSSRDGRDPEEEDPDVLCPLCTLCTNANVKYILYYSEDILMLN